MINYYLQGSTVCKQAPLSVVHERYNLYTYLKSKFYTEYEQILDVAVHNLSLSDNKGPDI